MSNRPAYVLEEGKKTLLWKHGASQFDSRMLFLRKKWSCMESTFSQILSECYPDKIVKISPVTFIFLMAQVDQFNAWHFLCVFNLPYFSFYTFLCLSGSSQSSVSPSLPSRSSSATSCPATVHRDSSSDIESFLHAEPVYDSIFRKVSLTAFSSSHSPSFNNQCCDVRRNKYLKGRNEPELNKR